MFLQDLCESNKMNNLWIPTEPRPALNHTRASDSQFTAHIVSGLLCSRYSELVLGFQGVLGFFTNKGDTGGDHPCSPSPCSIPSLQVGISTHHIPKKPNIPLRCLPRMLGTAGSPCLCPQRSCHGNTSAQPWLILGMEHMEYPIPQPLNPSINSLPGFI